MERIQQRIYLSRKGPNSLEFEHEVLKIPLKAGEETSFELLLINHGEPTHVHFSLSQAIRDKVMIMQDKVYVIEDEKVAAIVRLPKSYAIAGGDSGRGTISVSTGYGATKRNFAVEIVESREDELREVEEEKEWGRDDRTSTVKKKTTLSASERAFLSHLLISACVAILSFILVFLIVRLGVFSNSHFYQFVIALMASVLFMFIVIYNL